MMMLLLVLHSVTGAHTELGQKCLSSTCKSVCIEFVRTARRLLGLQKQQRTNKHKTSSVQLLVKDGVGVFLWCGFVSFVRQWGTWVLFMLTENQSKLAKEQQKKTELWTRKEESDTRQVCSFRFLILCCAVSSFWCCVVLFQVFNAVLCCFWFLMLSCAISGF